MRKLVFLVLAIIALALPLVVRNGYVLQTLGIGWLYAILAISLTLVAGTAGMISLGHAGLLAIADDYDQLEEQAEQVFAREKPSSDT